MVQKYGCIYATFEVPAVATIAAFCFVPIPAFADFACPVALIFECTPVAGCQQVTAEQANLPPAVTLNVREKRLFSGVFGGEGHLNLGMPMKTRTCSSSTGDTAS